MTSNVSGSIAAQNPGYARVEIDQAIARCDERCLVTVYLKPSAAERGGGREYFKI